MKMVKAQVVCKFSKNNQDNGRKNCFDVIKPSYDTPTRLNT